VGGFFVIQTYGLQTRGSEAANNFLFSALQHTNKINVKIKIKKKKLEGRLNKSSNHLWLFRQLIPNT